MAMEMWIDFRYLMEIVWVVMRHLVIEYFILLSLYMVSLLFMEWRWLVYSYIIKKPNWVLHIGNVGHNFYVYSN